MAENTDEVFIVTSDYWLFEDENADLINNALDHLSDWMDSNPDINAKNDKARNLLFFRGSKYDLEKTKLKLKRFYMLRSIRPEWFSNRDPFRPEIQELLKIGVFLPLEDKDEQNRQIVVIRTSAHNPKKVSQNLVLKTSKMILDILLYMNPEVATIGMVVIFDMSHVTLGHGLQMTPSLIKKSVESWGLYPSKPKLLEFVNVPTHVNIVLSTFRLFMTPKMKSRVIVRKTTSEVKSKLPKDLGGSGKSYAELAEKWKNIAEKNVNFFVEDEKYKSIVRR